MIDQLEQIAAEYVNWTIESMVISGRAALLILLTLFQKTRCTGFEDVKVMDLETFLEKLSASEARHFLRLGLEGSRNSCKLAMSKLLHKRTLVPTSSFPKNQLYKSIKKRHLLSEKLKDYPPPSNLGKTESFDVEKYDKLNVDERTYEDNVDEQTYEDVLNDVAGMNSGTLFKKAWGTGANDVEAPALGNTGPKTTQFVVDVADMDLEPYFVKPWDTEANDVEAPALGNTGPMAAMDSETFLEIAWGTVANCVGAPAPGNTGPRSQQTLNIQVSAKQKNFKRTEKCHRCSKKD